MSRFSIAFPTFLSNLKQQLVEHRHLLLGIFFLALSVFIAGAKPISAQTNDVDTSEKTCTPKPACMYESPACVPDPAPGFVKWCEDVTPSPLSTIRPMPSPSSETTGGKTGTCTVKPACMSQNPPCAVDPGPGFVAWCADASPSPSACEPRPACLDASPACKRSEPASGWCPASPSPTTNTCPADLSKDGFVDLIDYGIFKLHFLETVASSTNDTALVGDINGDGSVDLSDYFEIVRMFLKSCPVTGNTGKLGSPQPLGSPGIEVNPSASPDNILPIN